MRFPQRALDEIRQFVESVEPDTVSTDRAAELVKAFAELERLSVAGKVLFTKRVSESVVWAAEGHRTPASWLAETSGSSMGEAISTVQASERLEGLSKTEDALRRGELSLSQLKEVTAGAERDPSKKRELLKAAGTETLKSLQARSRKIRQRASSKEEECSRYLAIHKDRYCRAWNDEEGAFRADLRLAPDQGARFMSALQKETDVIFEEARGSSDRESTQAYRADALVALVTGNGRACGHNHKKDSEKKVGCGARTDTVVMRVDAAALRRGYAKGDELCEIPGVGKVPVANARRILGDGLLRVVIRDAVDVLSVCHVGRSIPAHLQSALEERDPTCVLCDCAFGLEAHHWREDYATCKTTSLDGLARLCKHHHDLITYGGYELEGGPGKWKLVPPPPPTIFDSS